MSTESLLISYYDESISLQALWTDPRFSNLSCRAIVPYNVLPYNETCSELCTRPSLLYNANTPYWVPWLCALWPNITESLLEHSLPIGALLDWKTNKFIEEEMGTDLHLQAERITYTVSACPVAYCNQLQGCDTELCSFENLTINGTMINTDGLGSCSTSICKEPTVIPANPDIAGIGVCLALAIQSVLILLGGVFAITTWSRDWYRHHYRNRREILTGKSINESTRPWHRSIIYLENIHKAQCFFTCILAFASWVGGFAGKSNVDLYMVYVLLSIQLTLLLIVLCMLLSFDERKQWWRRPTNRAINWICIPSWVLGLITYGVFGWAVWVRAKGVNRFYFYETDEAWPVECGNYSPLHMCDRPYRSMPALIGYLFWFPFSSLIATPLVILILREATRRYGSRGA